VKQPRRNIELKARDPDPDHSLEVCRTLGAEDHGTISQRALLGNDLGDHGAEQLAGANTIQHVEAVVDQRLGLGKPGRERATS
jgi:hypothetical protein